MKIGRSVLLKTSLVLLLCVGTIIPVIANSDGKKDDTGNINPKSQQTQSKGDSDGVFESDLNVLAPSMLDASEAVKINDQIEMRLTHLQMMPDTENQIVSFTLTINNDSQTDLNFIDYWVQLKSVQGTEYPIHYLTNQADKDLIPAKSSKDFQFYAEVTPDVSYDDLIFELVAWDFSAPNYRRTIGSIRAPKEYTPLVAQGQTGVIRHQNSRYHFKINEMHTFQIGNTNRLELKLLLENMSSRSTPLPNVSYSLLTEDGYIYLLEPVNPPESNLAPRIETEIILSGELPENIDFASTRFLVFSNGENIDLPLALYELPGITEAPEPPQIGLGGKYTIELDRTNVDMSVSEYTLTEQKEEEEEEDEEKKEKDEERPEEEKKFDAVITVLLENTGRYSGIVPGYEYTMEFTNTGDVFPLTIEDELMSPLHPRMKHEMKLTVTLPEELIKESVKLVVRPAYVEGEPNPDYEPVVSFLVPDGVIVEEEKKEEEEKEEEMARYSVREIYPYQTKQGEYFIYLEKMQRYPWENEDILAAEFIVSNRGSSTLQVPDITGKFKLNGIPLNDHETHVVTSNRVLGIAPGESIQMILYTKIPYSFNYSSAGLIITGQDEPPVAEDEKDQLENIPAVEFIYNRDLASLPRFETGQSITFDYISTKAQFNVREMLAYKSNESQTIYIQTEVENLENRESRLPELKAYLKVSNSSYIPLDTSYEGALSPGGKALLVFTSTVSNRYNINDMELIIGELIPEQDAYLNAVAVELPAVTSTEPTRAPQNLSIYPYTFSINSVEPDFSHSDSIRFQYELKVDEQFEIIPGEHQLIIEYVDDDAKFERAYTLGKDIHLGKHDLNFVIDIPAEELIDLIGGYDRFTINIYSQYGENRIHLSTSNYTYF